MSLFHSVSKWSLSLGFLAALASGCSDNQPASTVRDIGTDIRPNGTAAGKTYLYWHNSATNEVNRGTCRDGSPIVRTYCKEEIKTLAVADVEAALIGAAQTRKTELTAAAGEIQNQITAIDEILVNDPSNQDLIEQRQELVVDLEKTNELLVVAEHDLALAQNFFSKLTNDRVVFRITTSADHFDEFKPLVQQLAALFEGSTPTNPPSTEAVLWSDENSGRDFAAYGTPIDYQSAVNTCSQRGIGWHLINAFISSYPGCDDRMDVAKAVFSSHLANAIPETKIGNDIPRKLVWSRCYNSIRSSALATSMDLVDNGIHAVAAPMSFLFPVICEKVR